MNRGTGNILHKKMFIPITGRRANIPRQRANERGRARPERANTYAIDPNQIGTVYVPAWRRENPQQGV